MMNYQTDPLPWPRLPRSRRRQVAGSLKFSAHPPNPCGVFRSFRFSAFGLFGTFANPLCILCTWRVLLCKLALGVEPLPDGRTPNPATVIGDPMPVDTSKCVHYNFLKGRWMIVRHLVGDTP